MRSLLWRGKTISSRNTRIPDGEEFRSLGEDSSYKYLGVFEPDQIKPEGMKGKLRLRIPAEYGRCSSPNLMLETPSRLQIHGQYPL